MSKTVDERVVEMRFDNSKFESNIKTSISSLDKLKKSLKLPEASKGLEAVSNAAKKVDFSGISRGIETVNARFSSLQVIGMTALSNITTAAMQAGSSLIKSFTLDPITNGFREYELQMNSVQTILANTASKGTTMADVTAALDELNEYADMTIYNFSEMTRNIGTFTAAGVDLEKATSAIKGIANLGAMSGSTSQQVSTAMYQLSQALATGRVSLMDWNSVVNAGMGGEQFQNALKRTAEHFGTDVDAMIEKYGSFRESLTQGGWLTAEVLTETLNQISGAYSEADLIAQGYTADQAAAIVKMAETATDAATKVKTFTQLMDTLSEAAGSGWAKTWQILLGDFEEAKEFFTGLSDYLSEMINASSDARNELLAGAMDSNWTKLTKQIEEAGVPLDTFTDKLKAVATENGINVDQMIEEYGSLAKVMESGAISGDIVVETIKRLAGASDELNSSTSAMTDKLAYFQNVVDEVWHGDWKNGEDRIRLLTEAGYDYAEVQRLVNETVDGHRLTLEDLNETEMRAIGFTEEQITALQELAKQAEETGTPLNELINNLDRPSGRKLFLDSITNLLKAIIEPLRAVSRAFSEVFAIDSEQVYGIIEGLNRFSQAILMDEESLQKLTSAFKGVFGIIKVFTSLIGGAFGLVFNVATLILENFNLGILDVLAFVGELVYSITDFITLGDTFTSVIDNIGSAFSWILQPISDFIQYLSEFPAIQGAITAISTFFDSIKEKIGSYMDMMGEFSPIDIIGKMIEDIKNYFSGLSWEDVLSGLSNFGTSVRNVFSEVVSIAQDIGPDIIEGLRNGLSDGVENVLNIVRDIGTKILEAIKAILGIHSPSTEFFDIGKNIIDGLIGGIEYVLSSLWSLLQGIGEKILGFLGNIDFGTVLMAAMGAGFFVVANKISNALEAFSAPFEGIGEVLSSASGVLDAFSGTLKSFSMSIKANALKSIAIAIAILVGSIAVLTFLDVGKVWNAVGVIAVLSVILGGLTAAMGKVSTGGVVDTAKISVIMLSLGASLLMLAGVMKIISTMSWPDLGKVGASLLGLTVLISLLAKMTKNTRKDLDQLSKFIAKLSISLLLLVGVAKLLATMSWGEMKTAAVGIGGFVAFIIALVAATNLPGPNVDKVGSTILKIGAAMLLLVGVAKLIAGMSWDEMKTAAVGLVGLGAVITGLIAATRLAGGNDLAKVGSTILQLAVAIGILAVVAKLLATMSWEEMGTAIVGIGALGGVIVGLVAVTKLAGGKDLAKVGTTLLLMSLSIGILAGVSVLLGLVKPENLIKGIAAVAALSALVAGMTAVTKFGQDVKGTMIGIAVAIGVMAASVALLSLLDPARVYLATGAISVLMGMFALIVAQTGVINKAMGTVIALTATIAVLAAALVILSGLPIENVIASAVSLSALMIVMSGALKVAGNIKKVSPSAIGGMAAMLVVVLGLGGVLAILNNLEMETSMDVIAAISVMLIAMSTALAILNTVKSISITALVAIALMGIVVLEIGGIFALLNMLGDVSMSIETVASISLLMLAMSGVLGVLSIIGPAAQAAVPATIALIEVIGILAAAVAALGAIAQIPGVEWLVSEGGDFLQTLGTAIGQFVGGIVGGFGEGLTSSLPAIADNLSAFMEHVQPFIDGAAAIDPAMMEGVQALANTVLVLTAANVLDAIGSFIGGGGTSLVDFAEQLEPFGEGIKKYGDAVDGIKIGPLVASAKAGEALAELANTLPKENGLAQAIFGETTDMDTFGKQLEGFGEGLKAYSDYVTDVDFEAVTSSADAGQALSDLANTLPKENGLAQAIFGETTDMDVFGNQIRGFGEGLKDYSDLAKLVDFAKISESVGAGEDLAGLASSLGTEGGVISFFTGEKENLATFGTNLASFGESLVTYSDKLSYVNFENMSTAISTLKTTTSFLNKQVGSELAEKITNLMPIQDVGTILLNYHKRIESIDSNSLSNSVESLRGLVNVINSLSSLNTSGIGTLSTAISQLGKTNVDGFVAAFDNAGPKVSGAISRMLASAVSAIGLGGFSITVAFKLLVNSGLKAIMDSNKKFESAGKALMLNLLAGIKSMRLDKEIAPIISSCLTVIRNYRDDFENVGKYLVQGVAIGITNNTNIIENAARKMAQKAYKASMNELEANSPSKLFMEVGSYVPMGFAIGISGNTKSVENSASSMAEAAINSTKQTISRLVDVINSDIDTQPTIRPVLDLSDVESKTGRLNTIFSRNKAMAIDTRMNQSVTDETQNGFEQPSSGNTFQFTQNNYSPKALSRIEIYRQTKNQFSTMERMVRS